MKKIRIISPSFRISNEELNQTLSYLKTCGFEPKFDDPLFERDLLCSAPLDRRVSDFIEAFSDDDAEFIWALRGGYGAHQFYPHLRASGFKNNVPFMGFSDCTSLHYFLNQTLGWASIHGPHPNSFVRQHSKTIESEVLAAIQSPDSLKPKFGDLKSLNQRGSGKLEGEIVGGNLSTLIPLLGTPYNLGARGKFLFLEEIDEPAYKINRMLEHMNQAGFFKGVQALILGSFTHRNVREQGKVFEFLRQWAQTVNFPVLSGFEAGHDHLKNRPFWLGKKSSLHLDLKSELYNNIG